MSSIIVTGAGGVLGTAVAKRLVARGRGLLLTDIDAAALERTAGTVRSLSGAARIRVAVKRSDLTVPGSAGTLVEHAVAVFGGVAGCVNGAGVEHPIIASDDLTAEQMRASYDVNVFGLVEMCVAVIRHLNERGTPGRIVNVASGAALSGAAYLVTYNSSKHAVLGATRSLAREYAARDIALNAVCPGFIESRMVDAILAKVRSLSGDDSDPRHLIPARRFADPDEVAGVIEFLALDAPTYMTGSAVVVDGGLYA